jgi:hypothetical protein
MGCFKARPPTKAKRTTEKFALKHEPPGANLRAATQGAELGSLGELALNIDARPDGDHLAALATARFLDCNSQSLDSGC